MQRGILRVLALAMLVVFLAACGTKPSTSTPQGQTPAAGDQKPAQQQPATQGGTGGGVQPSGDVKPNVANDPFKDKVAAGQLPSLDKRLPDNPAVIGVRDAIGTYGGTITTVADGADPGSIKMWLYDPPVRWKEDYTGYEPGLAEKFEWSSDGKTITYTLRKGLKWSDGQPFTSEDFRFWWEDLANYPDSGILPPWWARNADGSPMEFKVLSETEFQFIFAEPNWIQPYILAQGFWEFEAIMKPKHYLSQFHPKYNSQHTDFVKLREMDAWLRNPDYPTPFAWVTSEYQDGERIVLERNPYYWKLDPQGNQLPYIDKIVVLRVDDEEVRLLKTLQGELDFVVRDFSPRNFSTVKRNEDRGNYVVYSWTNGAGSWPGILINQDHVGDPHMRELLRDKNFRRALSMAFDRENVNEAIWSGLGTVQQGTISKESPHFADPAGQKLFQQWQQAWAEYAPEASGKLLDEMGLKKGADGFRTRTDGKPLEIVIDITGWGGRGENAETAELMKNDLAAVGIKAVLRDIPDSETDVRFKSAEWMLSFAHKAELDLWTYPDWVFTVRGNRNWPMQGTWIETGGASGEQPYDGSSAQVLNSLYLKGRELPTEAERHKVVHEAVQYILDEGPFDIGFVGGIPMPVIARKNMKNVPPTGVLGPWAPGTPGNLNIITMFYGN